MRCTSFRRYFLAGLAAGTLALTVAAAAQAPTTVRIALAGDPDALDPTTARTLYGRIVFSTLCDKLFDTDAQLNIVPQLATAYEWSDGDKTLTVRLRENVVFHD